MEVSDQLNTIVPLHSGTLLPYIFSRKMFGAHRVSGWFGEGKNAFSVLGFDPRFVGCRALSLATIRPHHSCSCWTWRWKQVQSVMLFALKSLLLQRINFQPYCNLNLDVFNPVKVKPAVTTVWTAKPIPYFASLRYWIDQAEKNHSFFNGSTASSGPGSLVIVGARSHSHIHTHARAR